MGSLVIPLRSITRLGMLGVQGNKLPPTGGGYLGAPRHVGVRFAHPNLFVTPGPASRTTAFNKLAVCRVSGHPPCAAVSAADEARRVARKDAGHRVLRPGWPVDPTRTALTILAERCSARRQTGASFFWFIFLDEQENELVRRRRGKFSCY